MPLPLGELNYNWLKFIVPRMSGKLLFACHWLDFLQRQTKSSFTIPGYLFGFVLKWADHHRSKLHYCSILTNTNVNIEKKWSILASIQTAFSWPNRLYNDWIYTSNIFVLKLALVYGKLIQNIDSIRCKIKSSIQIPGYLFSLVLKWADHHRSKLRYCSILTHTNVNIEKKWFHISINSKCIQLA